LVLGAALSEGITTLWRQPPILGTIALMAVVGGLAWPVYGLMPAFAQEVVNTGSIGLGFLLAVGALGSVIGTVVVAQLGRQRRGRTMIWVSFLLPLLVIGFAFAQNIWLAALFLIPLGIALLVLQSLAITVVQIHTLSVEQVRGRVMSLYSMLHAGSDMAGNVVIGFAAVYLGLPVALSLGSVVALLVVVGVWLLIPTIFYLD
jgi:MFS family permease